MKILCLYFIRQFIAAKPGDYLNIFRGLYIGEETKNYDVIIYVQDASFILHGRAIESSSYIVICGERLM